jgi:hypothetical protein
MANLTLIPPHPPIPSAEAEINNLCWSTATPDWVTIAFGSKVQMLRV